MNRNFLLLKSISIAAITLILLSCTYHNDDNHKKNNKQDWKNNDQSKIAESSRQDTIDGKILQIVNKSVEKIEADFVDVNLKMSYGKFFVNDGAENFVDAEFIYDKYELEPEFDYSESGSHGRLNVELKGHKDHDIDIDTDNDYTKCLVEMNNETPMDLHIEFGAGEGKFNLNELLIEDLEMRFGAGEFDVNLAKSPLKELDIEAGVGKVYLDLSGNRKDNLNVEILGGIGQLDIKLPEDTGVRVKITGILGDIDAHHFYKNGNEYTNEAYRTHGPTIDITVKAGLGDVNLFLVE